MLKLERMLNVVKNQGGVLDSSGKKIILDVFDFCEIIKETIPFVSKIYPEKFEAVKDHLVDYMLPENYDGVLDLPYRICSFELLDEKPEKSNELGMFVSSAEEAVKSSLGIGCILAVEKSPREYLTLVLFSTYINRVEIGKYSVMQIDATSLLQHTLKSLYNRKIIVGAENIRRKIKLKKEFHIIRKIVHIRQKKETFLEDRKEKIDWSHQWRVRGHWRKIEGLGKNRNGDYNISNHTWIKDFIKGPEGLPLISKTYLQHY